MSTTSPNPEFQRFVSTLDRLMEARGLNDHTLNEAAGLSHGYVNRLRHRRSVPKLSTLKKLAVALRVDWRELDDPDGPSVSVPVFDVRAAAGDGALIDSEHQAGSLTFDRAYLRTMTSAGPERLAIIQVWGDSMAPTIPEGAWAMIDQTQRMPINRGIYAFRQDDDARVKRILMDPTSGRITLHSDNPAWEAVVVDAPESLDIIGRVIWYSKKLG